jgi:hypothetical protein
MAGEADLREGDRAPFELPEANRDVLADRELLGDVVVQHECRAPTAVLGPETVELVSSKTLAGGARASSPGSIGN